MTASRRQNWPRFSAVALLAILGGLVAFNVGLNLGVTQPFLAQIISVSPRSFALTYRRAWSFWPTVVYVRDFSVQGSDDNVQWRVEIEEARVSIDLIALFRREFHATAVRAKGIAFHLRQKLDLPAATHDRMAALPPISGLDGLPIREAGPPPPDISDANYDLWSVRLDNVDGRARQIWVDEFRFEGDVAVAGSFYLLPKRELRVGPAYAALYSGSISLGGEPLLNHISGSIDCSIPAFDPRPPVGMETFRFVSGRVRLDAAVPSTRALNYYSRLRGSDTAFDGGKGRLRLDGSLHSGIVRPIDLEMTADHFEVGKDSWLALGSLRVSTDANAIGPSVWSMRVAPVELRQANAKSATIRSNELLLQTSVEELDLSKPIAAVDIHTSLPSALVPDLKVVNQLLLSKSGLRITHGSAILSAQFDTNSGTGLAKGAFSIDANSLKAQDGALRFGGRLNVTATTATVALGSGDSDLARVVIDAREITMRDSTTAIFDWWGSVDLHNAHIRPTEAVFLDIPFAGKLANATPVLAFSRKTPGMPSWITRALAGGEALASGRLQAGTSLLVLTQLKAQTGVLRVTGSLHQRAQSTSGVFRFSAGPLSMGLELSDRETKLIFIGTPVEPSP